MSKNSIIVLALVVALGAVVFYFNVDTSIADQGRVVFGITDAAASIQNVSSIMMTVDTVEVQNATEEWVTVSSGSKQYDLLALKQSGAVALLADINLPVGTYSQTRLTISKVLVTASGVTQEAKLPSGVLKIVGRIVVEEGQTATAVFDFKADKSLHITGNGKYILAPVVHLQTKSSASVTVRSDNTLKIDDGEDEDDVDVGMDEHGETKEDFELDDDAEIEIDDDGEIRVGGKSQEDEEDEEDEHDAENVTVHIKNFLFTPSVVTVKKGTKVTWVNDDVLPHTVVSDSGGLFTSGTLALGQSFSFTFTNSGTVSYHCGLHPTMNGQVVVKKD